MALKNGDYVLASKCRKAMLLQNLDSYNSFLANNPMFDSLVKSGRLTEEDKKMREESLLNRKKAIEILKKEISHLETKDTGYFQQLTYENEVYSRKVLESMNLGFHEDMLA